MINKMRRFWLRVPITLSLIFFSFFTYAAPCDYLDLWQSNTTYFGGDKVGHNGNEYTANYWTRNDNPETNSGPWQQWRFDKPCSDSNTPPMVSISSPRDGSVFAVNDSVIINISATDSDDAIQSVEIYIADSLAATLTSAPYTYEWTANREGSINIRAVATDTASQRAETSINISIGNNTNRPPMVELTTPRDGSEYVAAETVNISASASDSDGSITQVDFYVDDVIVGSDSSSPFTATWSATEGTHQIRARATDNEDATTYSQISTITVTTNTPPGQCSGIPEYQAGNNYSAGEQVTNVQRLFRCDVAGWCSANAAWAYEPGVGQHWEMAWSEIGQCDVAEKPVVNLTSPTDNALILAGTRVNLSANASDSDGSVSQVEFFVNDVSQGVDNSQPYSVEWLASTPGQARIAAIATDNDNNQSAPASVLVDVSDDAVVTSITSPANGTSVVQGSNVSIQASASSIAGNITAVTFFVNGTQVANDTSAPYSANWSATQAGNYTVTSRATDDQGNTATSNGVSVRVVTQTTNDHVLVGYWHNFVNGSGCPFDLSIVSNDWDVIVVAFADNDRNSNGTVHFNLYNGDIHSSCAAIDPIKFKQDITSLKAQGKKIVLSLGGAEGTITLNNAADEANFVSSLTDIINEWGFDGLDIDLESGSNLLHGTQIQARLPGAVKKIQSNLGRSLYLSMAPEHPYVHGGMIAYSGIWGAYIPVIDGLRNELDLLHVQLYNNGGLSNPYTPNPAPEGSVDMMVASVRMLVEGFDLANGTRFQPLRADQVAIGLPSGPSSANSGQASISNIIAAIDCIMKATSCGSYDAGGTHPSLGGVMTWSINWDKHDGFNFSRPIGNKLHSE